MNMSDAATVTKQPPKQAPKKIPYTEEIGLISPD